MRYTFSSGFAEHIKALIESKRAYGYDYSVELSTSVQSKNTQNSNSSRSGGTDRVDAAKSIDNRR